MSGYNSHLPVRLPHETVTPSGQAQGLFTFGHWHPSQGLAEWGLSKGR